MKKRLEANVQENLGINLGAFNKLGHQKSFSYDFWKKCYAQHLNINKMMTFFDNLLIDITEREIR